MGLLLIDIISESTRGETLWLCYSLLIVIFYKSLCVMHYSSVVIWVLFRP